MRKEEVGCTKLEGQDQYAINGRSDTHVNACCVIVQTAYGPLFVYGKDGL